MPTATQIIETIATTAQPTHGHTPPGSNLSPSNATVSTHRVPSLAGAINTGAVTGNQPATKPAVIP